MLDAYLVTERNWRDAAPPNDGAPHIVGFAVLQTPRYFGRGNAAIAADPDRSRWNRRSVTVGDLAAEYGFNDLDGLQPDTWRYLVNAETDERADVADYR